MARIGVDARPLTVSLSGIGRYTYEVLRRMADSGHQIYLYSERSIPEAHLPAGDFICRHGNIQRGFLASLFAQWQFPRWARTDSLDLFWSPRHHLPLLLSAIPQVLTVHDMVWHRAPETMRKAGRLLDACLMPPSVRRAKTVIADSQATADDLNDVLGVPAGKMRVIHLASDLSGQHCGEATPPYILFVGTLEPRKNLPRLLRAYAKLKQSDGIEHRLVLVGQAGWMRDDLHAMLAALAISDDVTVTGFIDDGALIELYSQASMLAMPSLYEGFGLPLVEAMNFGVPLLTSNVASMPEVAADAAVLVDPVSEQSIYLGMRDVLLDNVRWQQLASAAQQRGAQFSWDAAAQQTLRVFDEVLHG